MRLKGSLEGKKKKLQSDRPENRGEETSTLRAHEKEVAWEWRRLDSENGRVLGGK